jgi:hypothetical protein
MLGGALLDAEAKIGELLKSRSTTTFKKGGEKSLPEGINKKMSHYCQQLSEHRGGSATAGTSRIPAQEHGKKGQFKDKLLCGSCGRTTIGNKYSSIGGTIPILPEGRRTDLVANATKSPVSDNSEKPAFRPRQSSGAFASMDKTCRLQNHPEEIFSVIQAVIFLQFLIKKQMRD